MCDENASCAHDSKANTQLSLLDLPIEIFLYICSFLEASTLIHNLSLVCKQFHLILKDDSLWKVRINRIWPDVSYPVLRPARKDKSFWKLSCAAIEKETARWRRCDSMEKLSLINVQHSTIDALLLMHDGTTCISGARDRTLVYWKLPSHENECEKSACIDLAHNGWIWDLAAIDNTIYSCSWDQSVKSWLLTNTGLVQQRIYEMHIPGALLCVSSCPERAVFATGSYGRNVFVFDSRSGHEIAQYRAHNRAVIKLAMNSEYILSASEDKTICIWDQRARRTRKSVTISDEAFPMCISMQRDWVYIGDSAAKLHVLDLKHPEYELVKSYATEHTTRITEIHLTHGCLITSSTDGTVRISSPTDPPKPLTTLFCNFGEVASMDYLNGVLAVSGTEGINIWRSKSMCSGRYL